MRSLVPPASMLLVMALALPAAAQREAQCFDHRASSQQKIEGCSAVIAAGSETADKRWQAYLNRAAAWSMSGDHKRAVADYGEALKLKPGDPAVLMGRCHEQAIVGDLQAALADCTESLRLQPGCPWRSAPAGWSC